MCKQTEVTFTANLLIIPNSMPPFAKNQQDYFHDLPTQAGTAYGFRFNGGRVIPFTFENLSPQESFNAFKDFVTDGSALKQRTILNLGNAPEGSSDTIYQQLDASNLQKLLSGSNGIRATDRWSFKEPDGTTRYFIRLDASNAVVILGVASQSLCIGGAPGTEDDDVDVVQPEGEDADEDHSPSVIENNPDRPEEGARPLSYPLKESFRAQSSYFFGPRIFESWALVDDLKSRPSDSVELIITKRGKKGTVTYKDPNPILTKFWDAHPGVDIVGDGPGQIKDQAVLSPFDGEIFSKIYHRGCGYVLIIRHELNDGGKKLIVYTRYLHLASYARVKVGQRVKQGEIVGTVGNTGKFAGGSYHLHFEVLAPKQLDVVVKSTNSMARFAAVWNQTKPVNSADYISKIDEQCRERKTLEVSNAKRVEGKSRLGPLTAGYCSQNFEQSLKDRPKVYRIKDSADIPKVFPAGKI